MTLDPGELTDLRSMSVSNNNFARISTKYKFYSYLQYDSLALGKIINEYVKRFSESFDGKDAHISIYLTKSPKVSLNSKFGFFAYNHIYYRQCFKFISKG